MDAPLSAAWQMVLPAALVTLALASAARWPGVEIVVVALIAVGGIAQAAGVLLGAAEVRATLRRLSEYSERPLLLRALPVRIDVGMSGRLAVDGPERSTEARLDEHDMKIEALGKRIDSSRSQARDDVRREIDEAVAVAVESALDHIRPLAGLVVDLNDRATIRRRLAAVALLLLGTISVTAGGVLAVVG